MASVLMGSIPDLEERGEERGGSECIDAKKGRKR
jgi:hypothetical protein